MASVKASLLMEVQGSSFPLIWTTPQFIMENRPSHTAKLPPNCRALVLIAVKLPLSLWFTPIGQLKTLWPLERYHYHIWCPLWRPHHGHLQFDRGRALVLVLHLDSSTWAILGQWAAGVLVKINGAEKTWYRINQKIWPRNSLDVNK